MVDKQIIKTSKQSDKEKSRSFLDMAARCPECGKKCKSFMSIECRKKIKSRFFRSGWEIWNEYRFKCKNCGCQWKCEEKNEQKRDAF